MTAAACTFASAPSLAQTAASTTLYKLDTQCSVKQGKPQNCVVEVIQEGDATLYRHKIGSNIETVRITDMPVRMNLWNAKSLRKNRQKRRVPPSRDLITCCSGWISLIQRFRTPDFRRFAPL
ncbi:hypothetical protein KBY65_13645, partial [Cyanobium sp. Alchichica 3B3-8F6]|nr:hypothetical protein [Cyanobium sp. Alchichica 3B3-8F6]